jgi:hypothetical protein
MISQCFGEPSAHVEQIANQTILAGKQTPDRTKLESSMDAKI